MVCNLSVPWSSQIASSPKGAPLDERLGDLRGLLGLTSIIAVKPCFATSPGSSSGFCRTQRRPRWNDALRDVDRVIAVEGDHRELVVERGVDKRTAAADSGVEQQRIDGTAARLDVLIELFDAFEGRQVGLDLVDRAFAEVG